MFTPVLSAAWDAWSIVFSWPNLLYPVIGTLLAMAFAVVPGISGVTLMAIAIPFTIDWDPIPIVLLFGSFVGGATFMGSVTAILAGIPGSPPNAATIIDGHPMAQKGLARTAIACSGAASALGSTFGVLVLIAVIPFMRPMILAFGPPEFMMLAVWGLTMLASLAPTSLLKGLAAAGMGLCLSFVGYDGRTAELRYTFGIDYLRDGLSLVPVFLGLFAVTAALELHMSRRETISGASDTCQLSGSTWAGIRSVYDHFGLFLRSSILGTLVGMLPGVGGTVSSFLAYGNAVHSSRDRGTFGKGDIRGVLAPEAANDAKDGGALVPLLAFGIPGGLGTAMLLAALTLHGISPGRDLLESHLSLVFVLVWSMFLSNWLTSIIGIAVAKPLARVTTIRSAFLVPVILVLATTGAYLYRTRPGDILVMGLFGILGTLLTTFEWPRVPLVVALVLGPMFERNLQLTSRLTSVGRVDFWTRPIAMTLLAFSCVGLALSWHRRREKRRERGGGV